MILFWFSCTYSKLSSKEGPKYSWNQETKTMDITGSGYILLESIPEEASLAEIINIADKIDGTGNRPFINNKNLKTLKITSSMFASIGDEAFAGCTNLEFVELPDSVKIIGNYAFQDTKITEITLGKSIKTILNYAFENCRYLSTLNINGKLEEICNYAFQYTSIKKFTIPSSLKMIGKYAFANSAITEVNYAESDKFEKLNISEYAFANSESLTSISLHSEVESIGDGAFQKAGLTEFVYNHHLIIGSSVFASCYSLTKVSIKVNEIGTGNFVDCISLTSAKIEGKNFTISESTFRNCSSLADIKLSDGCYEIGASAFQYCAFEKIEFLDSIQSIKKFAFSNNIKLTEVVLPKSLKELDPSAFDVCEHIVRFKSDSDFLKSDDNGALLSADGLTLVRFPPASPIESVEYNVQKIGERAFYMSNVKNVKFPNLQEIGELSFAYSDISSFDLPAIQKVPFSTFIFSKISQVTFKEETTIIGKQAFAECKLLKAIELPPKLKEIELRAFSSCPFSSIAFPETLKTIGEYAFDDCNELINVVIPESVETLEAGIFVNCNNLTTLKLPSNLSIAPGSLCSFCSKLQTVEAPGLRVVGDRAFQGCYALKWSFNALTTVGSMAFSYSGIEEAKLAENSEVEANAFEKAQKLRSIRFEGPVKSIGKYAFKNMEGLKDIYIVGNVESWSENSCTGSPAFALTFCGTKDVSTKLPSGTTVSVSKAYEGETFAGIAVSVTEGACGEEPSSSHETEETKSEETKSEETKSEETKSEEISSEEPDTTPETESPTPSWFQKLPAAARWSIVVGVPVVIITIIIIIVVCCVRRRRQKDSEILTDSLLTQIL